MLTQILDWIKDWWSGKTEFEDGFRGLRSRQWTTVRNRHIEIEPTCQWCGRSTNLQVHHVQPFHICPEKELDEHNLITLCESEGYECHRLRGHLGNWRNFNPHIRAECKKRKRDVD